MSMQFPQGFDPDNLPDHLADTGPSRAVMASRDAVPGWRRVIGLLALLGALGLTGGAAALFLLPPDASPTPIQPTPQTIVITPDAPIPTQAGIPQVQATPAPVEIVTLPTLAPDEMLSLLLTPIAPQSFGSTADQLEIVGSLYNPFTIIPDRPRSEVIQYEVQSGDTIFRIAERFGLEPESIAWANERSIIGGLRPGRVINILPVNGAYYIVNEEESIASIAQRFRVEPFAIIDSEFNDFFGAAPDTLLPVGTRVVIPGGTAETIVWSPPVERVGGDSTRGGAGGRISFAQGDPGSCGFVDNPGGGAAWVRPLAVGSYQWTRGFTSLHPGVDLAGAVGTPIYAANSGTVIFAGWNSYGYGYLVVLAHGAYTTVYGHLSAINVGCGQFVNAGQQVGAMGASGNASGPHLHFEIRYNDIPQNPTTAIAF
jgi:murein DD-endopeptidase MepM/ murein hydrolase activator NlpD